MKGTGLIGCFFLVVVALQPSAHTSNQKAIPNYELINQDGKKLHLHELKGKYIFVSFIYSRCPMPKMCPLTMKLSNQLVTQWKKSKTKPLQVLAVTLDPENDTVPVLRKFGKSHSVDFDHFMLVTGKPQVISDFSSEFNAVGIPSGGLISHNSRSVLLDPKLRIIAQYTENEWTPEQVLRNLVRK